MFELRGPIGGYFVWDGRRAGPVLLVAGGSGVVPLMAMARAPRRGRRDGADAAALLVAYARGRDLPRRARPARGGGDGFDVVHTLTREQPPGWTGYARRIDRDLLAEVAWPAAEQPRVFVCGSTRFVDAAADGLLELGYDPAWIRTERFGATGAEMEIRDLKLDGNAIGGLMLELFGADLTAAGCVCSGCGAHEEMARLDVYTGRRHRRPLLPLRGRDGPDRPGPRPHVARPQRNREPRAHLGVGSNHRRVSVSTDARAAPGRND